MPRKNKSVQYLQDQLAHALQEIQGRDQTISQLQVDNHRQHCHILDQQHLLQNRADSYNDLLNTYTWEKKCRSGRLDTIRRLLSQLLVTSTGPVADMLTPEKAIHTLCQILAEVTDMEVAK